MPLELSVFCDESGSDGLDSRWYLLTIVVHDQSDAIGDSIAIYESSLASKGLPNAPFHASPLMYAKDDYRSMPLSDRKRMLSSFRVFFRHLPIRYWTLALDVKEHGSAESVEGSIRRALVNLLFDNLEFFQRYDAVKIYYDNGQRSVAEALHKAFDYALSQNAVVYRPAGQTDYRLSQAADYICTMELAALKYASRSQTATDERFFGSWSMFKKGILKEVRGKRFKS